MTTDLEPQYLFIHNPNRIEHYSIFHDVNSSSLINGDELLDNNWDDEQKSRWLFFYRPWYSKLPQVIQIKANKVECEKLSNLQSFVHLLIPLTLFLFTFISGFFYFHENIALESALRIFFTGTILVAFQSLFVFLWSRRIKRMLYKVSCLKKEIALLKQQLPKRKSRVAIDCDVKKIQCEYLLLAVQNFEEVDPGWLNSCKPSLKVNSPLDELRKTTSGLIQDKKCTIKLPSSVYVLSGWAGQQSISDSQKGVLPNSLYAEKTLKRLGKENHFKLWSWRVGEGGKTPLFRFPYYQLLVVSKKGLVSYGFFSDLVPAKEVGDERAEFFHYQHISNISRTDISPEKPAHGFSDIPEIIKKSVFESKSDMVSFSVSSGEEFSCTFMSEITRNRLNELMQEQNKLFEGDPDYDELKVYDIRDELDSEAKKFIRAVHDKLRIN